jgi:hypothetical protein
MKGWSSNSSYHHVILSGVSDAQSASDTESKDPYSPNLINKKRQGISQWYRKARELGAL